MKWEEASFAGAYCHQSAVAYRTSVPSPRWNFAELPSREGSACSKEKVCATTEPAPPGPAQTSQEVHPAFSSIFVVVTAVEGAPPVEVEVVALPTVKFVYAFTTAPSFATTVMRCAPAGMLSDVDT